MLAKKLFFIPIATAGLILAYLLGSVTLTRTSAQTPQPASPTVISSATNDQDEQPGYISSIRIQQDQADVADQTESSALQSQAKITAEQARAAALAQYPGAQIFSVTLENENGSLVYGVQLTDANGHKLDVKVDAGNGKVLHTETDSGSEQASQEDAAHPEIENSAEIAR